MDDDDNDDHVGFERSPYTVNEGPWLLLGTATFCLAVMVVALPWLLHSFGKQHATTISSEQNGSSVPSNNTSNNGKNNGNNTFQFLRTIVRWDKETKRILKLAAPYTLSIASTQIFSLIVLIMIAQYIGNGNDVVAYAMVHLLLELTDGILMGPIHGTCVCCIRACIIPIPQNRLFFMTNSDMQHTNHSSSIFLYLVFSTFIITIVACATLSSHAVGAENYTLGGQYSQLAALLYVSMNIPVMCFWYFFMDDTILLLNWGDDHTASLAQDYVRTFLWGVVLNGLMDVIVVLWDIEGYASVGSAITVVDGAVTVLVLAILLHYPEIFEPTLEMVGWVNSAMSLVTFVVILIVSYCKGYLVPYYRGLFGKLAIIHNPSALRPLLTTALPLSGAEVLGQAEWAVLTCFAGSIGLAEAATWAILGTLWDLFSSISEGVGEAAEIRISLHLGNNNAVLAERSTYKSLFLGLLVALIISVITFSLENIIPAWFTQDPALQQLLKELIPFVGVANVTMVFGMNCWYILGAQNKFVLATWIMALSSWGICLPLAALFTLVCHFDLQGLASAVASGYVIAGGCLSYITIITEWDAVALKVSTDNEESSSSSEEDDEEESSNDKEEIGCKESSPLLPKIGSEILFLE